MVVMMAAGAVVVAMAVAVIVSVAGGAGRVLRVIVGLAVAVIVRVARGASRVLRVIVMRMPSVSAAFVVTMRTGRRLAQAVARDTG
jgi:hypothetical protein